MSKKPAKLDFQDLPFLKLVAGFLLLVLTSTIVASDWLTGPSPRVEKESEIFEVTPPADLGGDFQYKRSVTLDNPSAGESKVEILLTVPTDDLVTEGKMQSSCNDMRFTDSSGTVLKYWIESGCDTTVTQVWIELHEPLLAGGAATIYMYYGDPEANSKELVWNQGSPRIVLPFNSACPSGWEPMVELNQDRFARGNTVYGGTGGGVGHHHRLSAILEPENSLYKNKSASAAESPRGHTHRFEGDTYSAEIVPPFVETVFCQLSLGADKRLPTQIPVKGIAFFTDFPDTASWTRLANFDGKFLRGGDAPGSTGGSSSHTHHVIGTSTIYQAIHGDSGGGENHGDCIHTHSHYIDGYTDVNEVLPSYLSVVVASSIEGSSLPQDAIVASNFTSLPPLGWKQFSDLNNRFPRGGGTYGEVGGSETHQHTTSFDSAVGVGPGGLCDGSCKRERCSHKDHRHKVAGTTDEQSSLPKYFDVIYVQKKVDSLVKTYNDDETPVTPTSVPAAPASLSATDGIYADKVVITWDAVTDAADYEIYRADSADGVKTERASQAGTTYEDGTVTQGTTYYYWVKACNGSGCSDFSASDTGFSQEGAECQSADDCDLPNTIGWGECNYVECVSNNCVYSEKSDGTACTVEGASGQCEVGQCIAGASDQVGLTVKFAGVTSRPTNDADQTVKIWGESLDGTIVLAAKASPLSVVFSVDDQGLYAGILNLTEAQLDKHYRLVIKGPRHLGREFADVVLDTGSLVLTGAGQELLPGDLNQDGLVNSVDVGIVNENTRPETNPNGDLNYDNYTTGLDKALILQTLSVRQDPR